MDKIPLSEMLAELRKELLKAQGEEEALKFRIEDIEIELQVGTTKEGQGKGSVKFWVYNAEAGVAASQAKTQKLKLKLKPVHSDHDKPFDVGDQDELAG